MKIKYNPVIPILAIVLSVFFGISFFYFQQKGVRVDPSMKFIVPLVFLTSIPMLFINYLEVSEREIIVRSQFGSVLRRYAINNMEEIEIVGKKIYLNKPSKKEQVKFNYRLISKRGFNELREKLHSTTTL